MKVLIVDDSEYARHCMAKAPREKGHGVHEADGGEAALRLPDEIEPDAVTVAIPMSGMGGIELT